MKDMMYSIVLPTCCCLWLTMVQVLDGKPYAGKRLSYEGMDWSFGGWTPLDGGGGGGGGFTGMSSIAHHPSLTQHFSSSSPSLGLLNSNDPSSVMDSDMIQFLKQVPSSVTPPPELHGLDHQTHQSQNHNHHHHHHHHQQHNQPPQSSPSIVSQVNDSPSSSPRALRFAQSPQHKLELQHQQQQPVSSSSPSWPSLLPVNSNNNNVSGNMPSSSSIQTAPASSSLSYAVAHDGPTKIRVEPKPLRQAQIEAYKVIEQLESDSEKQKQILSAQGPTFLPLDIPSSAEESYNSQGQAMSYSVSAPRESRRKSNSGYSNGNSLSYGSQRQTENHQTLAIPVKEIGKDYVTLPVAVETDEDKVLTPQEIKEIEKEVLNAIPESLGNPDTMYEAAIPLDEMTSPEQYMLQNAPSYGGKGGGNRWPKIPKFMSALSPSKVKISDLLRPLLRKVRPGPLPPSPGHQLHGMSPAPAYGGGNGGGSGSKNMHAPMIPAGSPYSNTGHRPENLDVIHLIAGPAANSYQPAVIHVSQLVRHKNRGPMSGGKKRKNKKKKKSGINSQNFNPYPGFEGAAAPPSMPFAHQYQSSPFGGNGNPFSQGMMMNSYPSSLPGMRPSAPASGPNYGQQSGIKGGVKGGAVTTYQVINGNQQESYEINHGSQQQQQSNNGYNTQPQIMTGYSGPSTGNNNYEEMISIALPPSPPSPSYGQSYPELSHMPPAPFQHVNQRPHQSPSTGGQSYGSPSGNQNEYIEVINLPPRGGQSVEYNPGPAPSSGSYNGNNNNQGGGYHDSQSQGQQQQSGYNEGSQGPSYSAASSIPSSSSSSSSSSSYGDQSSNNNPSYESNQNSAPHSSAPSSNYGGGSGATIELIDGSTSPNFNYKGVTSLNPKELVELIAKQVPSLKDVLTPGNNDNQGSSSGYANRNPSSNYQSQNSGPDVSYEVIQMPPIYHNKESNGQQEQQEPSYSPAVNYAGKAQESGESSYEGGNGPNNDGNNYQSNGGYTPNQGSSYSSQPSQSSSSSSSSSDQSSYQPPYESPAAYDQQQQHNLHSPSVQYSSTNSQTNYEPQGNNNNYINYESNNNNNNQYQQDESQRSNVIASHGSSSVQLPSSTSSSSAPSSSHLKFGQRLTSTPEFSSSSSSSSGEETLSQPSSPSSSSSSISGSQSSGSDSVLSQLYSTSGKDGGRVKVSPVKVLTKESEEDEFKEDSNLAGLLLSESSLPLPSPASSSEQQSNSSSSNEDEDSVAKSRK